MAITTVRLAENPAWLMIPLALASRSAGLDVRARSKPIIEAGPPIPITWVSTTSSQNGAGPGQARTAVHTATIVQTMVSTVVERCQGCRPMNQPMVGPLYITATTTRLSSRLALRLGQALAPHQEREPPQQRHRGRAELGDEVHPEAESGARLRPGRGQAGADRGQAHPRAADDPAVRCVMDDRRHRDGRDHARQRRR